MKTLTSAQRDELISQYCELMVDSMDYKSLEQFVYDTMVEFCEKLTDSELKEEISLTMDDEIYEELVDNVTSQDDERELTTKEQIDYIKSNLTKED